MGLPSGTFTSPYSGKLQVTFSGDATAYGTADPGFSYNRAALSSSTTPDCTLECTAGDKKTRISFESPSNFIEIDYVAGTSIAVSMTNGARRHAGAMYVGFVNLRIRCILMKR